MKGKSRSLGKLTAVDTLEAMKMPFKPDPKKTYISTREAADLYGCTMGRIRQLALAGDLWCGHLHDRALVYDLDEVKRKAKEKPSTGRPRKRQAS
jgi:hypothetical protein